MRTEKAFEPQSALSKFNKPKKAKAQNLATISNQLEIKFLQLYR